LIEPNLSGTNVNEILIFEYPSISEVLLN